MDQMPDIGSWDRHTWWRSKIQNAYLSENVLKETDQKYAKYVNVPYTRLQDFEAINLLLFLVLPSFILWKSVNVRNICKLTLCKKKLAEPLSWGICLYVFLEKHSTLGPDQVQLIIFEIVSKKTNNLSCHLQLIILIMYY